MTVTVQPKYRTEMTPKIWKTNFLQALSSLHQKHCIWKEKK